LSPTIQVSCGPTPSTSMGVGPFLGPAQSEPAGQRRQRPAVPHNRGDGASFRRVPKRIVLDVDFECHRRAAGIRERWMASVKGQDEYDAELRIRRADGQYRWFKARGTPVRDGGRIVRWFGSRAARRAD